MAVQIPFPLPSTGFALNSKMRVNLDFLVDKFNEFNSGTATWDTVAIGTANSLTGTLTFYNSSNANYLTFQPGATSANITYTLPATNPAVNNSILRVATNGVMSWTAYGFDVSTADNGVLWISGGTTIDALENAQGTNVVMIGSSATSATPKWVKLLGTTNQVTVAFNTNDVTLSLPQSIDTSASFQVSTVRTGAGSVGTCALQLNVANIGLFADATNIYFGIGGGTKASIDSSGNFVAIAEVRGVNLRATTNLQISTGASGIVTIQADAVSGGTYTLTLPINDGGSNEVLTTNGSGVLSWTAVTSLGGANTALSNLASVAINTTLVSDTDNTDDLGTSSIAWKDLYLDGDVKVGSTTAIDLASTAAVSIRGTNTNDSAATGFVGEYVSSAVATGSAVSSTGTTQWFDVTSISLTAGDWDISCVIAGKDNGATISAWTGGIGTATGNNGAGLVQGDNRLNMSIPNSTEGDIGLSIPAWRVSITSTTTYYLKALFIFSAGTPQSYGRISARRVR